MSVKIVEYRIRLNSEQKPFLALILQGGIEIVKSANGNVYATAKKASLATTFDEATCKSLICTFVLYKTHFSILLEVNKFCIAQSCKVGKLDFNNLASFLRQVLLIFQSAAYFK